LTATIKQDKAMRMLRRVRGYLTGLQGLAGRRSDEGAALITALMFLLVMTMLGLAALMTSGTEMMISRNDRLNKLALDYANAGVQEALARLDMQSGALQLGNYSTKTLTASPAYVANFSSTDSGTSLSPIYFSGTMTYRIEDNQHYRNMPNPPNAGVADGEVVGYSKDCGYDKAPVATWQKSFPVYVITSTGKVMQGSAEMATATVKVEVTRNILNINAPGGMFSGGCLDVNGASGGIAGGGSLPGVITNSSSGTCTENPIVSGTPAYSYNAGIDMNTYLGMSVTELVQFATVKETYTSNVTNTNMSYSSYPGGDPAIVYIDNAGHSIRENGCTGYGILVVTGDLVLGGGFNWHGLVYVMGNVTQSGGGGNPNIDGSIMAGGNMNILNGGIDITANQAILDTIARRAFNTKVINWQRVYN